jgi:hypothetical protein
MKTELNQGIRSTGVLSVIGLLFVCAVAASPLWSGKSGEEKEVLMRHAESLAYQVIEIHKAEIQAKIEGRSPSSLGDADENRGQIGTDPWGHPFQYQIVDRKNRHQVFVWSLGPNATASIKLSSLDSSRGDFAVDSKGRRLGVVIDF